MVAANVMLAMKQLPKKLISAAFVLSIAGCTDTGELHPVAATVIAVGGGVAIAKEQQRRGQTTSPSYPSGSGGSGCNRDGGLYSCENLF